jgi:segregation and condensation protein A
MILEEFEPRVPSAPDATEGAEPAGLIAPGGTEDSLLIQLQDFEGPLDLLLYLIQRDELDIYNIPIAQITAQYLEYIELIDVFDLDNAGEFLVMAATLMRIKARLLLPVTRPGEEDDDDIDPRDELVRRLLEYKKYKEAAQDIAEKEQERAHFFGRGSAYPFLGEAVEEPVDLSLSLFDLLGAVRNVLQEMRGSNTHRVYTEVYTVEGQEEHILRTLAENTRLRFEELFTGMTVKMEVVVTFAAVLDLLKSGRVRADQSKVYGEIWLEALEVEQESPESNTTPDGQGPAEDQDD